MAWFRVDDGWIDHPKARRAGRDGRDLWVAAGTKCAKYWTDGWVEGLLVADYALLAGVTKVKAAIKALVGAGLWHDHLTLQDCRRCSDQIKEINEQRSRDGEALLEVGEDDFFFHDWWTYQQPRKAKQSVAMKDREDRARALRRDTDLCREIQRRDRGHCRYCLIKVDWNDRRSKTAPTYDHVDPECFEPAFGNFLDGVVTACKRCNSRKRDLTPAQAGMTLKPVPEAPGIDPVLSGSDLTGSNPKPDPDLTQIKTRSNPNPQIPDPDLTSRGRNAQDGPGQVRSGFGLDPGSDRDGPGGAGSVGAGEDRGGDGPDRDGSGSVRAGPGGVPCPDPDPPPDPSVAETDAGEDPRS